MVQQRAFELHEVAEGEGVIDQRVALDTGTTHIRAEIDRGVGIVSLESPWGESSLDEMCVALGETLECFADESEVGCVVVVGESGARVDDGDGGPAAVTHAPRCDDLPDSASRLVHQIHGIPQVTIAALPGPAVGIGMTIALAADLRVAGRSAHLVADWGTGQCPVDRSGAWLLTRLVGPSRAMQLLLDGAPIEPISAFQVGLVNRVVDDADVADAARRWARLIAAKPLEVRRGIKDAVGEALFTPLGQAAPLETAHATWARFAQVQRDAARAWLDAGALDAD